MQERHIKMDGGREAGKDFLMILSRPHPGISELLKAG
jgi:hypothetical protein